MSEELKNHERVELKIQAICTKCGHEGESYIEREHLAGALLELFTKSAIAIRRETFEDAAKIAGISCKHRACWCSSEKIRQKALEIEK